MNTEGDPQLSATPFETGKEFAEQAAALPVALDRAALFEENQEWARIVARNVHRKLPPSFDIEDLEQIAVIEMWKRCLLYDPQNERGAPFQGFAYLSVRGAVLMHCRRRNWKEATHESLSSSGEADRPETLNTKGANDGMERWSIGRKGTVSRIAADQRATPEQALQAEEEVEIEHGRLVRFFSAIPPPVPDAVVLVRTVVLDCVGLDELASDRRLSMKELASMLSRGVRQLRKFHGSPLLEGFDIPVAARPIRRGSFHNGLPVRFSAVRRPGVAARG